MADAKRGHNCVLHHHNGEKVFQMASANARHAPTRHMIRTGDRTQALLSAGKRVALDAPPLRTLSALISLRFTVILPLPDGGLTNGKVDKSQYRRLKIRG